MIVYPIKDYALKLLSNLAPNVLLNLGPQFSNSGSTKMLPTGSKFVANLRCSRKLDLKRAVNDQPSSPNGVGLSKAVFSGSELCAAKLSGAELNVAEVTGAELSEAELSGAEMSGAELS